ncbi:MAG: NAD metabolism ATPase/kinase [Bacteroidetes bacterium GWF2_42_66]|nr:MAG: NAD metabolism ATPase/kinase [Bacteroidetes bacterium GWA2_42_15]OFY03262.1 MAG: NAD metabolism ATPase/kinase [Bacteroidetes bacterium GWE2_42_39]OFY45688.1 MAG: NAD metabolism ATPase/kinase [Bacteroidetes bacterium GWF2_42_66]HBL77325.1 DUF4301 domain-containing protein [Prolixibacteraceae bacterium]HCR91930.1 DUF4301 domain-containing protein [Prolixibacteraceae bacterium]
MLTAKDKLQIGQRGSDIETIEQQIRNFIEGFPFLKIISAATVGNGLIRLQEAELKKYIQVYNEHIANGITPLKFIPASGAASRMFKALFSAKEKLEARIDENEIMQFPEIADFFNQLKRFAFYPELERVSGKKINELSYLEILNLVLTGKGLNYGNQPKGLLGFHSYGEKIRTPMEEHLAEGAHYAKDSEGRVKIHFTVSPEHRQGFAALVNKVGKKYENEYGVAFEISFSQQKPSTDTIAVDYYNEPFREANGSLLFRPAGHGALLDNLNELDADLIFIKNIDNVVPDRLKKTTVDYKKALAGLLINLQEKIFYYQEKLDRQHYYTLNSAFFAEASNFLENVLNVKPPQNQYYSEKEELYHYLKSKYNRPLRVCGMVKNEGEPGGGPFWAVNNDGSVSLQIAESSQIDPADEEQQAIAAGATHFNPVDLVCAVRNYKGEKYDLLQFRDPDTGFISVKSKDGKELKAQELPGLWNGAMADWNTLFVEVPVATFNPAKTVNDLLRKEHQPD